MKIMIKKYGFLVFLITGIILFATRLQVNGQSIQLKNISDFQIKQIKNRKITIAFTADIENTSRRTIKASIKKGKLYKNDEYIGSFRFLEKVTIPRNSSEKLPVLVVVEAENRLHLVKDGLSMLFGNSVTLSASGFVKGSWLVFSRKVPFEIKEQVALKDLF